MIDPVVHAALVIVFTWLVQLLFAAIGLDLGNEVATGIAQVIVAYILSLFGLGAFRRFVRRDAFMGGDEYKPPFV